MQYAQGRHDDADEHLDPYYSRPLGITEQHCSCLRDFAEEPAEFEFDVDRPVTINRCSDFVWAALHYAGLHPLPAPLDGGSNLGEFAVLFNLPEIQCVAAPFPGSDLNAETHHAMTTCCLANRPKADMWPRAPSSSRATATTRGSAAPASPPKWWPRPMWPIRCG